ncbi:hypothetical protein GEV33_015385 [Tenebrio molitor]|nr:hypothetical protein GEV33_015385 [Tenebrio molitor]
MMVANTDDENSLINMASRARLVVNCTGPYRVHGEAVVRACIQQNCHYIDICAEPQFMERMQLLYNEEAANKGVYVVPSCGVDSIPSDMGVDFVRKSFEGTLNSVEVYQEVVPDGGFAVVASSEDSWIVGKVRGRDGYQVTGLCAAVSALVLVGGSQKLPQKGGVYTTAPVFTDTELVVML